MVRLLLFVMLFLSAPLVAATIQDDLQINLSLSKEKVWQREQVTITLNIITNDPFARLDSDEYEQNGFTIISLDQEGIEKDGKLHMKKEWVVFPFVAGEQLIQLPRIRYRPNSGRSITLKLPQKTLTVLKLPLYVPPTMPVGTIELESEWGNGRILSTNTLYDWTLTAKAKYVAPQTLPAVSSLLRSSDFLQILPFKKVIKYERESTKNRGGVLITTYQVPFKALSFGRLELPEIAIQYFEPESGKLKKVSVKHSFVFVINPWLIWFIAIALFVGFILIFIKILPYLQAFISRRRIKKEALNALANATNYQDIRSALSLYAKAMDWGKNITLNQFALNSDVRQLQGEIETVIEKLRENEFSSDDTDKLEIKKQASALVKILE